MTHAAFIAHRGTVCIPIVASYAGEWQDRNLTLVNNGDDELIRTVADNCDNTIPIVQSVGPVDMEASFFLDQAFIAGRQDLTCQRPGSTTLT